MREQSNGMLFSPERKKASVKINGKEEGSSEGRRRLSTGGYGGKIIANSTISNVHITSGRLKGGSTIQSKHHSHELLVENIAAKETASGEGEQFANKRKVAEESVLPQWGHGKRLRCNRFEPSKSAARVAVEELALKSTSRPEQKPPCAIGIPAPKLRGPSKLAANKPVVKDGLFPRTTNGFTHSGNGIPSVSLRQIGSEVKERALHKERASSQLKKVAADQGMTRQQQGSDGPHLATTQGNAQCNSNINKNRNDNNGTSVSIPEPTALVSTYKPRVDVQNLEWPRISIALTRKEKEDDFLIFKGTKLPQRPKKRPKAVEKILNYCTPGNWLSDLSRGRYDVREKKSMKKKPAGLKAMESVESDSE